MRNNWQNGWTRWQTRWTLWQTGGLRVFSQRLIMQSRKPPLPRKPVLPPKLSRQCAQASGSPRPWVSSVGDPKTANSSARELHPRLTLQRSEARWQTSEEVRPPASPLSLSPRLPGRIPREEFPTPALSPRETALAATGESKEERPGFKSPKPRCKLAPQHGCRSGKKHT